jgi:RHS repeat-associated protein
MIGLTQGRRGLRRLLLAAALLTQAILSLAQAAPTVSLTSPGEGWLYNAPANLPLRASATPDSGTTIARVEFYANGNLVGQDATAAYAFNWNGVAAGTYVITARAIDSTGAEATSAARTVTVSDTNQPPTVSLAAPANNATYALPADITVTASASAVERNGSVTQVEFFANDVLIGTDSASPFSIVWSNPAPGTYVLTARATDNLGAQTTSAARSITVTGANAAPTVSLTAPANNAKYYLPASLTVNASASGVETNTPVTLVEFFANDVLIGSDTASPWSIAWANPSAGIYVLTARATDSAGAQTTSAARTVTITDSNTGPTVALTAPANNAKLYLPASVTVTASASGVETNTPLTQVEFFANGNPIGSATASPWSIAWANPSAGIYVLTARATDSGGAQTTSAARTLTITDTNLGPTVSLTAPANNAKYQSPASLTVTASATGPEANTPVTLVEFLANGAPIGSATASPWSISWANPPTGTHTLTARATDSLGAVTTSAARTVVIGDTNLPPTVSLTAPANNAAFIAPATITITANAAAPEANGTVANVEFLANGTPIGSDAASPWSLAWSVTTPGSYQLTARATDEQGAQTTSSIRTITVLANQAPTVSLTSPTANQSFAAPASIQLTAEASDPDNALAKVEFFQNGNLIATVLSPPYASTWENVAAGSYPITAKATDALGAETTTAPITISVTNPQPTLVYLHADHLNTPRLATDETGKVVWRNLPTTEPFGNSPVEEDPDNDGVAFTLNLRFPGQYFDKESGFFYNMNRYYDSQLGRYTSSDPIGLDGGINTYSYVRGNPLSRVDPLGLSDLNGSGGKVRIPVPWWWPILPPSNSSSDPSGSGNDALNGGIPSQSSSSSSSSSSAQARCEAKCDATYDFEAKQCEAWWKTTGRNSDAMRVCMDRVRANHIQCIQDCAKDCK